MTLIRKATADDMPLLARVYVRALDAAQTDEHWNEQCARALMEDWFRRQADLFFVAEDGGELLGGFVVGVRPWWDGNHLIDGELFVDPSHQQNGLARALIKEVLLAAIESYKPVNWETYTFNDQNFPLDWYKRLGFKPIEEWIMIRADVKEVLAACS